MDKISQSKNELENIKILLDRKSKEIEIIKQISNQINKSLDLNLIASSMLSLMDEFFGFKHSMILLVSENKKHLNVLETYGYKKKGIGAKVEFGVGVIGIVAEKKKRMRMANLGMQRSYMQAIREQVQITNKNKLQNKVELPGLKNSESQVAIPMLIDNELVGVFSVESEKMNIFDKSDEILIGILANQTASALENARLYQLEQKRLKELKDEIGMSTGGGADTGRIGELKSRVTVGLDRIARREKQRKKFLEDMKGGRPRTKKKQPGPLPSKVRPPINRPSKPQYISRATGGMADYYKDLM